MKVRTHQGREEKSFTVQKRPPTSTRVTTALATAAVTQELHRRSCHVLTSKRLGVSHAVLKECRPKAALLSPSSGHGNAAARRRRRLKARHARGDDLTGSLATHGLQFFNRVANALLAASP